MWGESWDPFGFSPIRRAVAPAETLAAYGYWSAAVIAFWTAPAAAGLSFLRACHGPPTRRE